MCVWVCACVPLCACERDDYVYQCENDSKVPPGRKIPGIMVPPGLHVQIVQKANHGISEQNRGRVQSIN